MLVAIMVTRTAESMYHLCQKRNIQLLRYDFNEPCCGKDQCDGESAAAKSILRSFIDAGNDVMNAEDVYEGLHYGFGMKNTKVAVAKIEKVTLSGQKIRNITDYHSIEFRDDHMVMWKYYNIGNGIVQTYNAWNWPVKKDKLTYDNDDILFKIKPPSPLGGSVWQGDYSINPEDYNEAVIQLRKRNKLLA